MRLPDIVGPQKIDKSVSSDMTYGKFVIEPFERGYGHTIGNSLRRILLSSLEGAAIIGVRIKGATHEFATLPGVVEDVMGMVLNLKKVRFKMYSDGIETLKISVSKGGEVKASAIESNANVDVINKDQIIATLESGGSLEMEIDITRGRGYSPSEKNKKAAQSAGTILVDAVFTPVRKVYYEVENTRVGQETDYDRLILEVWTDGSINPEDAVAYSAKLLKDSVNIFINFEEEITESKEKEVEKSDDKAPSSILEQSVEIIELSIRASNCLKIAKIKKIGELTKKSREELLAYKNFGRKSLEEIEMKLKELGVTLKETA
ncbi:MAG: DNA-directed RNA polymerase subunit alpha [Elusimicrobia bacterium RIFOXYC2_FULL_34_12]|nr:MAG: DNA-directed RNA polymerase subunit alpha [Elusimicrobia bacterium RIFOXYC2_FULL_34_12]OGS38564.1 MAG: DNA-directed RNA polymerase subunit alpha [Elusimicrobia bacterium RIFOXYD2_FULL_34_30]HAM38831.1 DNA-directed RNA polymerase subunit alpha [Elusimicrobiota bacterium]